MRRSWTSQPQLQTLRTFRPSLLYKPETSIKAMMLFAVQFAKKRFLSYTTSMSMTVGTELWVALQQHLHLVLGDYSIAEEHKLVSRMSTTSSGDCPLAVPRQILSQPQGSAPREGCILSSNEILLLALSTFSTYTRNTTATRTSMFRSQQLAKQNCGMSFIFSFFPEQLNRTS